MAVISITRELGTRGVDVANAVAQQLGLDVVNDQIIERDIAERTGMREDAVHRYFDGTANLLERWRTDNKALSEKTAEEVYELALKGNVVLRGWGAPFLLRDIPHAISVRICAPMAARQQALVARGLAADPAAAQTLILRQDAANDAAMRRLFGTDGMDMSMFAMVLNTGRLSVEQCAAHIATLAADPAFQETAQTHRAVEDKLALLRVQAAIEKRFGTDRRFTQIDVEVVNGRVTLTGRSILENANVAAAELVGGLPGVTEVDSRIAVTTHHRRSAA